MSGERRVVGALLALTARDPDRRAIGAVAGALAEAAPGFRGVFSLLDPARPVGAGAADRGLMERALARFAAHPDASSFVDDRSGLVVRAIADRGLRASVDGAPGGAESRRARGGRRARPAAAPMVLGGLVCARPEPRATLLEPVAGILALWLSRAAARLELTARQRALELGLALSAGLLEESESPLGLDRLLERLRAIVPCDALSVVLPTAGGLRAQHAVPKDAPEALGRAVDAELARSIGGDAEGDRRASALPEGDVERVAGVRGAAGGGRAPRSVGSSLVLAVPDPDGGEPGFLGIYAGRAGALQPRHLRMLALVVPWLGSALVSARRVRADRQEARGRRHELARARVVQQELEPGRTLLVDIEVASHASAADGLSGDVHEVVKLSDGCTGIFVGDVCGHGAPAAVVGSYVRGLLRRAWEGTSPAGLLSMLNAELRARPSRSVEMMFVTACAAVFSPTGAVLTYATAGHPPPIVRGSAGPRLLSSGGVPLGAFDGQTWEDSTEPLARGDVVVFYTDGVSEALPDGRLERAIGLGDPDETVRAIATAAAASPDRDDDRTVIALRVL